MAVLLVIALVATWSVPTAGAEERMRVVIDIRNSVVMAPAALAAALEEATSIWGPHGVTIEHGDRAHAAVREKQATFVPVTLESARSRGYVPRPAAPLGWTGFAGSGPPAMRISIFYDMIAMAASAGVLFGVRDAHATVLRERLAGRVLGRALAHEVGHVVLSSPEHSPSGLMRAGQTVQELQHPSRAGFGLDERDIARLQRIGENARVAAAQR